ncbi:MAG: hypothetical protein LIO37_02595 [Clostridiales bacterium]|nr:hypothetical protein [Clostridiales bacterium]
MELYFIRKKLDIRRQTKVCNYEVSIYRDFEEDGTKYRGCATALIYSGMDTSEITDLLNHAYASAASAKNPWYPLPQDTVSDGVEDENPALSDSWMQMAMQAAEAAFSVDTRDDVFLNSMEVFARKKLTHIVNSEGVDVAWVSYSVDGELVAQCLAPQDVETFEQFEYDHFDRDAFCEKIADTLQRTLDRAYATEAPKSGTYRLILSDKYVPTVFDYFTERSANYMIYPGYSQYKVGDDVQGGAADCASASDSNKAGAKCTDDAACDAVTGDRLDITLLAADPYSSEGIPMVDRPLLRGGVLQTIHGGCRFAYYLNTEPTGFYRKMGVAPGNTSIEEMKQSPYLHVVNFSDFQMDSFTGSFAGEIRLAYLYDGETVTRLTGGSVNGNIHEAQKSMHLSSETQDIYVDGNGFTGPKAICFDEVTVAGQ